MQGGGSWNVSSGHAIYKEVKELVQQTSGDEMH